MRFAEAITQQAGDLPEIPKGQRRLAEVESERAPQDRGEARAQEPGYSLVRVDLQDEPEGLGELPGDRSDQAGDEQRPHVVGAAPGHRPTRVMNGLEVVPLGTPFRELVRVDLEADPEVLGDGVAV